MGYAPELSVLFVTHNKPRLAVQFALSIALAPDTPKGTELLIYQSGNPLGLEPGHLQSSLKRALGGRDVFGRTIVVEDPLNAGIAIGFNALVTLAQGRYLFLCNDDCIVNVYGWYAPLKAALESDPKIGLVCSELINGGFPYKLDPTDIEMQEQIYDFSNRYRANPQQKAVFSPGASNQPWLLRKEDTFRYAAASSIVNRHQFLSEWIDPFGPGWHVDWDLHKRIESLDNKVGVVSQSIVYHYDHVTVRERDQREPGWTRVSEKRHFELWGTTDKPLVRAYPPTRFLLKNDELVPLP